MEPVTNKQQNGLYILMLNLHGLVRAEHLELGCDSDTGGQTAYVIALANQLAQQSPVEKVDLVTRLIDDEQVDSEYAQPVSPICNKAQIVRLGFGGQYYLKKEALWPHLNQAVDLCIQYLREQERLPDLIHTHYADAAYVGEQVSLLFGIPLVHTGHSLGKPKRDRMLASGKTENVIEKQFNFERRILSEEAIIEHSALIVTSTKQEIQTQYGMYRNHGTGRFQVIPPGIDTNRFWPPKRGKIVSTAQQAIDQFLTRADKPMILSICRADGRKNIHGLVKAYADSPTLQAKANLVIIAGTRDDIADMAAPQAEVLTQLLLDIDRADLWGKIAIPKQITQEQIPEVYRLATQRRGVFVNAAFTEPFGLTLIEAAASGLPIVAPDDGGPQDIIHNCQNGYLSNTLDSNDIADKIFTILNDPFLWRHLSKNGLSGVRKHYSWTAHVKKYLKAIQTIQHRNKKNRRREQVIYQTPPATRFTNAKAALISDIDNTLLGDHEALANLMDWLKQQDQHMAFGVATGRHLQSTVDILKAHGVPTPDVLITSVGTEIHYGQNLVKDKGWAAHIRHEWRRDAVMEAMTHFPKIKLQAPENQLEFKASFLAAPDDMPALAELQALFTRLKLRVQLIYSHDQFLDILPIRASKGQAIRYLSYKWDLPLERFVTSGDSGNDTDMLAGDTLGIAVGNHASEIVHLKEDQRVYFANGHYAAGIIEGLNHYQPSLNKAMAEV